MAVDESHALILHIFDLTNHKQVKMFESSVTQRDNAVGLFLCRSQTNGATNQLTVRTQTSQYF